MSNLKDFDNRIDFWNHRHIQDNEHIHYLQKCSLQLSPADKWEK